MEKIQSLSRGSIAIFEGGFETSAPVLKERLPAGPGGIRKAIAGWSAHSRARMRHWMLTHEPKEPGTLINVTLTVPGPPLTPEEIHSLFHFFSRRLQEAGWAAVWRLELQKRGAAHWHLCAWMPHGGGPCGHVTGDAYEVLNDLWRKSLKTLGEVKHTCKIRGDEREWTFSERWQIPGADERAVHFEIEKDGGWAWRRYMQDHATKSKQEQIAEGVGRHWGVIGRARYKVSRPVSSTQLSVSEYYRVLRWLRRLTCGTVRDDSKPFKRKVVSGVARGRHGVAAWFTNPATVRRMIELATVGNGSQP